MNADAAPYASLNNSRSIGAILIDNGCLDPQQAEGLFEYPDRLPNPIEWRHPRIAGQVVDLAIE